MSPTTTIRRRNSDRSRARASHPTAKTVEPPRTESAIRTRRRAGVPPVTPRVVPVVRVPPLFWGVALPVFGLSLLGLVMVLSASSVPRRGSDVSSWYYFGRHAIWLTIGTVALVVANKVDYRIWLRLAPAVLGVALAGLVLVLLPTPLQHSVNGAKRWLGSGGWGGQPSEIAKLGLVLWLAALLARRADEVRDWRRSIAPAFGVLGALGVLILAEPDLGTVILLAAVTFIMLVVAGTRLDVLAGLAVPSAAVAVGFSMIGYRKGRLLAFLDPWKHAKDWGYQTLQSQVGLADGGLFGVGLGNSRAKWGFLPEAHTDFIYAIIGEEFGLIGCLVVLGAFVCLFVAGMRVSLRSNDRAAMLMGVGVSSWIGFQALVNIGVVIGALPNKGITLPFVSYGGSSLMVTMFATGLLLQVARRSGEPAVTAAPGRRRPAPIAAPRAGARGAWR